MRGFVACLSCLFCTMVLSACSYTTRDHDKNICELTANADCREDEACSEQYSPEWEAYYTRCMQSYGHTEAE